MRDNKGEGGDKRGGTKGTKSKERKRKKSDNGPKTIKTGEWRWQGRAATEHRERRAESDLLSGRARERAARQSRNNLSLRESVFRGRGEEGGEHGNQGLSKRETKDQLRADDPEHQKEVE